MLNSRPIIACDYVRSYRGQKLSSGLLFQTLRGPWITVPEPAQQYDVPVNDGHRRQKATDSSKPLFRELPRGPSNSEKFQHELHVSVSMNKSVS